MKSVLNCTLMFTISFLVVLTTNGFCSETISFDGYYKNFFAVYKLPTVNIASRKIDLPPVGAVSSRLRLNSRWKIKQSIFFSISYDLAPRIQDHSLFINSTSPATINSLGYRVDDLDAWLYPSPGDKIASFAIFQNLDRAYLEIRTSKADFFIGRQAIAFGSARVVNPTDILAPYTFETLDTEDRIGVDAFRVRIPLGFMGEIDAGYVFGKDFEFEQSAIFLRTKFHIAGNDLSLMTIGFRENLMIGLDITRSVGGAGVWLESAHTFSGALKDDSTEDNQDYFRTTVGCDYSLGDNTYGFIEYHFNQAGADNPQDYLDRLTGIAYTDGAAYLLGRHYFIPGVIHQLTPLVSANMEILCNASDWSLFIAPSIEYNMSENIYLAGGAFIGVGKNPSLLEPMRSEFGSYPDIFYTSFRLYF